MKCPYCFRAVKNENGGDFTFTCSYCSGHPIFDFFNFGGNQEVSYVSFEFAFGWIEIFYDKQNPAAFIMPGMIRGMPRPHNPIMLNQDEIPDNLTPDNIENWVKRMLDLRMFL